MTATSSAASPAPIRVKFVGNYSIPAWMRQFPGGEHVWGNCRFLFDHGATDYDWFVVYNDMPNTLREELLCCPQRQSMLVTNEPSNIKSYGRTFCNQFGHVLTSQEAWALPHASRIYAQSGLQWYYGLGNHSMRSYDEMLNNPPLAKSKLISTVCSTKQQRHTLHYRRYRFTQALKQLLPELEIYGHGVREIDDKAEALDDYRYHVAIENFSGLHHWTEKLADPFLGVSLPFYYGCTNLTDYFPAESFIRIDINDVPGSYATIRRAMDAGEYEKRLPAILEARRRVMEEYNLFAVLSRLIETRTDAAARASGRDLVLSRRLLRRRKPLVAVADLVGKWRLAINNYARSW